MAFFKKLFGGKPEPEVVKPVQGPQMQHLEAAIRKDPENTAYYPIVCPYCLKKYHIWDLEFRTMSVQSDGGTTGYPPEEDDLYLDFWAEMQAQKSTDLLPKVLKLSDAENVTQIQLWDDQWCPRAAAFEADGKTPKKIAIKQVRDKFGLSTSKRICPHCHNGLPDVIGLHPNYIITMMGNTSCGKTVYLKRLLDALGNGNLLPGRQMVANFLTSKFLDVSEEARELFVSCVQEQRPLGEATPMGYIEPEIIDFVEQRKHTLVTLFDFPGEAIWQDNAFFARLMQNSVDNTNGWLFLMDSATIPSISNCIMRNNDIQYLAYGDNADSEENRQLRAQPGMVLSQFMERFAVASNVKLPVAFVFSKADLLSTYATQLQQDGYNITPESQFLQHTPNVHRAEVDLDDLYICNRQLRKFLGSDPVLRSADIMCEKHAWFASSATGVPVESGLLTAFSSGRRIVEPLEWLLWVMGVVPAKADHAKGWRDQWNG